MVYQLVWSSAAHPALTTADIDDIVSSSIRHNGHLGLTGMLFVSGSLFLQLLEGERSHVIRTYDRICTDHRHSDVQCLFERDDCMRASPCWSMGMKWISEGNGLRRIKTAIDCCQKRRAASPDDSMIEAVMTHFLHVSAGERSFV